MRDSGGKVVLGMSGGVDSSVALHLLKKRGFDVVGVTLKFFRGQDTETAKKVCQKFGVKHLVVDASRPFEKKIISYFLREFKKGRTPSPCLFCNREVKIELLFDIAKKEKADYIATGHYAKIKDGLLLRAEDKAKDQTYFLAFLKRKQLRKLIFPLGDYTKKEVCEIAKKEKIKIQEKPSQDLCFITSRVDEFLKKKLGERKGKIIDTRGKVLGGHQGTWFYTIGQRKGIRLSGGPYWVRGFEGNDVIVTKDEQELFSKKILLSNLNFLVDKPKKPILVEARLRYNQQPAEAILKNNELIFKKPQRAPAPGQAAVFYRGDICLGGGVIK